MGCHWGLYMCKCNFFGCNCETDDDGYCYKWFVHWWFENWGCRSTQGTRHSEHCEKGKTRKKRSVTGTILEGAYAGGLYDHLMEQKAMETFINFDLNKDGRISREEANATLEEFKQVDENNDGFVHPGELDMSLR